MKQIFLMILTILLMSSCEDDSGEGPVKLRIRNVSNYRIDSVYVKVDEENLYGMLDAKETSSYKSFDYIYRYAYVSFKVGGDKFVFQPIDYVGETRYDKGKYTYNISITDYDSRIVDLTFEKD